MTALGFDFDRGRLDVSLHPFCGGSAGDIRITTRYDEADVLSGLMGVLHETGHALYEAGLPEAWRYQPVGQAGGMALHESQSLLIEMQACRSRPFMRFLAPLLAEHLDGGTASADAEALYRQAIRVEPGFIRVDSDEVTYPAHIMLRYRLERALIADDLTCSRDSRCLGRDPRGPARHQAQERCRGVPAGHPLVRGRAWLLSELHHRRADGGAILRRRSPDRAGALAGHRARRFLAPLWVAPGQRARPRVPLRGARCCSNVPPGHPSAPPSSRLTCGGATSTEPHAHWFLHVSR